MNDKEKEVKKMKKNIYKFISSFLGIAILICICGNNVFASSNQEKIDNLKKEIIKTEQYQKYEKDIKKIYAENVNENGQVTVAYTLEEKGNEVKTLLFVGNDLSEFEQILLVNTSNNEITVNDLVDNSRTRAHLGYCTKHTCVKTTYVSYNPGKCPPLIGQACQPLKYIPNYGFYLSLLCRGGVWVACNIDFKKKCTAWDTYEYECSVP